MGEEVCVAMKTTNWELWRADMPVMTLKGRLVLPGEIVERRWITKTYKERIDLFYEHRDITE